MMGATIMGAKPQAAHRTAWLGVLAAVALCVAFLTPAAANAAPTAASHVASHSEAARASRALDWAIGHARGHTYLYGAAGPGSYDCSGLVMAAYAHAGVTLPHNTVAMLESGKLIQVDIATAPRGALLFFGTGHVELKSKWWHWSFGAHSSSDPIIGWRQWSGSWQPTAAYVVAGLGPGICR